MVTAMAPLDPLSSGLEIKGSPQDLEDDEILINSWCAEDLLATPGDKLTLSYYVVDQGQQLIIHEKNLTLRDIFPMKGHGIDSTLTPELPGLSDAQNCRDWNTGIPIDLNKIRKKDEIYWNQYKGTPKAVISLSTAQKIWDNRFGNATAIRFPNHDEIHSTLNEKLPKVLSPKSIGLIFSPVREMADKAVDQSLDFGVLFISFSFFLIAAALLLTGLLFSFHLDQRSEEQGTLLAIGFTPRRIKMFYLFEGLFIAIPAGCLGALSGALFAQMMLLGLSTLWVDAVGNWRLVFHGDLYSKVTGPGIGIAMALLTQYFCLRKLNQKTLKSRLLNLPGKF